eukprot:s2694_g3.t1
MAQPAEVYLFDGLRKGVIETLHPILASKAITKVMHDCQEVTKSCSWASLGFPSEMQILVLPYVTSASQQLMSAISEEDYDGVLSSLEVPADPNAQYTLTASGTTKILSPLVVACAVSNLSIVRALVQARADVNCQSHMLPCTAMVAECSVAEISEFCAVTPLQMAVLQNSVDLADYLLQAKADVNICSSHGVSALFIATRKCDLRCVKLLLHAGAETGRLLACWLF